MGTWKKMRLWNAIVRQNQVLVHFCENNALDIDDIDTHVSALDGNTLRMLVIDLDEI